MQSQPPQKKRKLFSSSSDFVSSTPPSPPPATATLSSSVDTSILYPSTTTPQQQITSSLKEEQQQHLRQSSSQPETPTKSCFEGPSSLTNFLARRFVDGPSPQQTHVNCGCSCACCRSCSNLNHGPSFHGSGMTFASRDPATEEEEVLWDDEFAGSLTCHTPQIKTGVAPSRRCWSAVCSVDDNIVIMGGYEGPEKCCPYPNDAHMFNSKTGVWTKHLPMGDLPSPRYAHTLNYVSGKLYIFGGDSMDGYLNDTYILKKDLSRCYSVQFLGEAPKPRAAPASCVHGDDIYYFGGDSGIHGGYCSDMFKLDTIQGAWQRINPTTTATTSASMKNTSTTTTTTATTTTTSTSSSLAPPTSSSSSSSPAITTLTTSPSTVTNPTTTPIISPSPSSSSSSAKPIWPTERGWHSISTIGNSLYMFGGYNGKNANAELWKFDLKEMTWSQPIVTGPSPSARYSHSASVVGSKFLVIVGGYDGVVNKSDVFVFNSEKNTWVQPLLSGSSLPPCHGHAMAYIESTQKLLFFGGFNGEEMYDCFVDISMEAKPSVKIPESTLSFDFETLFKKQLFCDVHFEIGDRRISAHKGILSCRSQYFRAMFAHFSEKDQDRVVIPESEVSFPVFSLVLEFLYSDNVIIPEELMVDVLLAAAMYNLLPLVRKCEGLLEMTMDVENTASLFNLAEMVFAEALKQVSTRFITRNYFLVEKTESFQNLSVSQKEYLFSEAMKEEKSQKKN